MEDIYKQDFSFCWYFSLTKHQKRAKITLILPFLKEYL